MSPATPPPFVWGRYGHAALAFVAGYVDTVGFVALFGLFTAHVTGNFVLIGAALAAGDSAGLVAKLLALPVFLLVVAATTWLVRSRVRRRRPALGAVLLLQLGLLLAFLAAGVAHPPAAQSTDGPLAVATGMLGVACMAVQNAYARLLLSASTPSTVMTGNVTQWMIDAVDRLSGDADPALESRLRNGRSVIVAFAVGTIGAALLYRQADFHALWLAAIVLAFCCHHAMAVERRSRAADHRC